MSNTYKTRGIVLRCLKYGESSVIVDMYTHAKGLRSYIVSGLSSKKDRSKASCYQHLNIVDIVAYDKPSGSLARIKEQRLHVHYRTLPYDVRKSSVGLFCLEVCKLSIKEAEVNEALYEFLEEHFISLDAAKQGFGMAPIFFLLNLAAYIGIQPRSNYSQTQKYLDLLDGQFVDHPDKYTINENESYEVCKLLNLSKQEEQEYRTSKEMRSRLLDHLIKYYKLHIDQIKEIKSLEVLRTIF